MKKNKILVTGAGGFIGGAIVEALWLSGFGIPKAGIRRWSSAARIGRFPIDIVQCDVMDSNNLLQVMKGTDVVVHCALGPGDVGITGTENVARAASESGLMKLIHISTTDVYGDTSGDIDENVPLKFTENEYGNMKIRAEEKCFDYYNNGLNIVVLRPPIVFGPFSKLWTIGIRDKLLSGRWGLYKGIGEGYCNLLYIDDLVKAVFLSIENDTANNQVFNVNGNEKVTWNEYFSKLNDELGYPPLREISSQTAKNNSTIMRPVRFMAKSLMSRYGDFIMKIYIRSTQARNAMKMAEKVIRTTPTGSELALYNRKAYYKPGKISNLLGYFPNFDVKSGIELSVAWLKHHS